MSRLLCIAMIASVACSGDSDSGVDAAPGDDGAGGPVDLAAAQWVHTNVFNGPGTSVASSDLAVSPSGTLVAAWAEIVESSPSRAAILVATGDGTTFETETVFDDPATSFSTPRVFAGSAVHLAAAATAPVTNSDIFYSRQDGAAWDPAINITGPADAAGLTQFDPIVFESGGEVVIVYRARDFSMTTIENDGVYLVRFTSPTAPSAVETVLDRATFDCASYDAAVDAQGAIHILAQCREGAGDAELFYLNNNSGGFSRRSVALGGATSPLTPDLALAGDGTVHLLWNANTDCNGITCRDVYYSRDLEPAVSVTGGEEDGGFIPQLTIDGSNRPIVAFHRFGAFRDVLWSYAENGSAFVRIQLATPGTQDSTDTSVGNLITHPITGRQHMVYSRAITGAGSDVFHAELMP